MQVYLSMDKVETTSKLRAFSSTLSNVPNAKYLAHLAHQSQKPFLITSSKSQKIWDMAIVPSQIWDGTDINAKHCLAYLIRFFSLLLSDASLTFSPSTSLALFVWHSRHAFSPLRSRHCWSFHAERQRPPKLTTDHWPTLRRRGTPVWRTRWPEVKTSINNDDGGGLGCGFVWFGWWDAVCWIL